MRWKTQGPARSGAGCPAAASIAVSRASQHWKQPVTPVWGTSDPSSSPALSGLFARPRFSPKTWPKKSTGVFPISALGVAQKDRPGFTITGATKFTQQHEFSLLYHLGKVKSRLKSQDSQEITLSLAYYPQAKTTGSIPIQGSISGMTTSSALPGRD